ncbi:histone deacetylase complex subunit SAP25 isoform X2 [Dendropsophus ebraccatus]
MSCCDYTDYDYDSLEEEEEDECSVSSADGPEASPHRSQTPTQCDASLLCSTSSATDLTSTCRVLHHPTFEAYYAAVAVYRNLETWEMQQRRQEGITANPGEYFYTDPLLPPGHRVYNCLSSANHSVLGCFRLQAPPPIMASFILPSIYDPMVDEAEDLEDAPSLQSGWDPLAISPQLSVLGCADSSPIPYMTSELEAVSALLCLASGAPSCAR